MKKQRKMMPLWWRTMPLWIMVTFWVIIIILIAVLLVKCWGHEIWFPSLAYFVAAAAIAASGCVAYHHLRVIQGTERAEVLTNLDITWMGQTLEKSRISFLKFQRGYTAISDPTNRERYIKDELRKIRENDEEYYRSLIAMVCFFEAIGYYSHMRYISPRDALELYGPAIRDNDEAFRGHILELQEKHNDKEIYANFLRLADEANLQRD